MAFDGTKIAANAARAADRSEAYLRKLAKEFLDTAAATDAAEDERFGEDNHGDELPEPVADRSGRGERIRQSLEQITARRAGAHRNQREQDERARAYDAAVAEGLTPAGGSPKGADLVAVAKTRWQRERAKAQARYEQLQQARERGERRRCGHPPVPPDQHCRVRAAYAAYQGAKAQAAADTPATAPDKDTAAADHERYTANLTDPHSRLLKTRTGWVQGYNCQTATSDDEFIVCARATQDANDLAQFVPTMNEVTATAARLSAHTRREDLTIGTMVGDAGYDSQANLAAPGPDRLIADGNRHTLNQRAATDPATGDPPADASPRLQMNHRLRTPEATPSTNADPR